MGDPRSFKRPVRVTVPRALPTDDVLVVRERRGRDVAKRAAAAPPEAPPATSEPAPWKGPQTLDVIDASSFHALASGHANGKTQAPAAVLCATLGDVRAVLRADAPHVRAVIATFIPTPLVPLFSVRAVAALEVNPSSLDSLRAARTLTLPAPSEWPERDALVVSKHPLRWLALGIERTWTTEGPSSPKASLPLGRRPISPEAKAVRTEGEARLRGNRGERSSHETD